jgi:hypothetical protein
VLHTLHRELGLLEKKQMEKFSRSPGPAPRDKTPSKP